MNRQKNTTKIVIIQKNFDVECKQIVSNRKRINKIWSIQLKSLLSINFDQPAKARIGDQLHNNNKLLLKKNKLSILI